VFWSTTWNRTYLSDVKTRKPAGKKKSQKKQKKNNNRNGTELDLSGQQARLCNSLVKISCREKFNPTIRGIRMRWRSGRWPYQLPSATTCHFLPAGRFHCRAENVRGLGDRHSFGCGNLAYLATCCRVETLRAMDAVVFFSPGFGLNDNSPQIPAALGLSRGSRDSSTRLVAT